MFDAEVLPPPQAPVFSLSTTAEEYQQVCNYCMQLLEKFKAPKVAIACAEAYNINGCAVGDYLLCKIYLTNALMRIAPQKNMQKAGYHFLRASYLTNRGLHNEHRRTLENAGLKLDELATRLDEAQLQPRCKLTEKNMQQLRDQVKLELSQSGQILLTLKFACNTRNSTN